VILGPSDRGPKVQIKQGRKLVKEMYLMEENEPTSTPTSPEHIDAWFRELEAIIMISPDENPAITHAAMAGIRRMRDQYNHPSWKGN
jgi:hypothetical protein